MLPPAHDAACGAWREDVLEPYAQADDPQHPVRCRDEPPVQRLQEPRGPIAATHQQGTRVEDAAERHGTASIGMVAAP